MSTAESFAWNRQVVVITGASAGIGAALARTVAERGAATVLVARRAEKLAEVASGLGAPTLVEVADVTVRAQVERVVHAAETRFGRITVWVNNAGRGITKKVEELADEDLEAMMRDNVHSALYGMQAVLPVFKRAGSGHIINVSSMLGRVPWATMRSAYSAAKHALESLTENLRMDLAETHPGIAVSCVHPGVVATDFGTNSLHGGPDSRRLPGAQPVDEVAAVIADCIATRKQDVYTRPDAVERVLAYYRELAAR